MKRRILEVLGTINEPLARAIADFAARSPRHSAAVSGATVLEVMTNAKRLGIRPASPVTPKPVAPRATVARPAPPPPKRAIVGVSVDVAGGNRKLIEEDEDEDPEDLEDDDDEDDSLDDLGDDDDDDETEQDEDDDEDDDEKETIMPKKNAEETKLEAAKKKLATVKAQALASHARPARKSLEELEAERDAAKALARGDR